MLMRNYAADLEARIGSVNDSFRILDDLVFAEGRFLRVRLFEDFNGRV